MSRFEYLLKLAEALGEHPQLDEAGEKLLRHYYPPIRLWTPFGFSLEGLANNAVLTAFMNLKLYDPFTSFMTVAAAHLGGTYFDIGANIGYFSLLAATCHRLPITVHAFEPLPENFRFLQRNIARSPESSRIAAYQIGLGDIDGEGEISNYGTGSSFVRGWDEGKAETAGLIKTPIARLDSLFEPQRLIPPVVFKIDVEGFEGAVLRGGERLFRFEESALILVEVAHAHHPGGYNPHAVETIERITEYGFRCYGIAGTRPAHRDAERLVLIPFEEVPPEPVEEWPKSWVCLRPVDPVEQFFLKSVDLYSLFRYTYHLDSAALETLLRHAKDGGASNG